MRQPRIPFGLSHATLVVLALLALILALPVAMPPRPSATSALEEPAPPRAEAFPADALPGADEPLFERGAPDAAEEEDAEGPAGAR